MTEFEEQLSKNPEYVFYFVEQPPKADGMRIRIDKCHVAYLTELEMKLNTNYQFVCMNGQLPRYKEL